MPTIAVAAPGLEPEGARIVMPAAVPGVHAAGHLVRSDGVVTLYAPRQDAAPLPAAAQVLTRILAAVEAQPCR